jgi:hypothetical protein
MLKLYIYGFMQGMRSSRKLARECERNLEVMWLMGGLKPSYKAIAEFRKENLKALKAVNQDFVMVCRELGLYGGELEAIDGSYFRGNVGKKSIYTEKRLKETLERLEKRIEAYLSEMEQADEEEDGEDERIPELAEKLEKLKARQKEQQEKLKKLRGSGKKQLAEVDEDARLLSKNGQSVAGYNVQTVVDEKHKLLVCCAVTQDGNDTNQLAPMAKQAKETLGVDHMEVVADKGYYKFEQIAECLEADITPYLPEPDKDAAVKDQGRFTREQFHYDAQSDCYLCPAGQSLRHYSQILQHGQVRYAYRSDNATCAACPLKPQCHLPNSRFRSVYRWEHEEIIEALRQRMARVGREKMALRACLAEHPFGTIKRWCGLQHFLLRTLAKVSAEFELWMLGYNFKRVLSILGLVRFKAYCLQRVYE